MLLLRVFQCHMLIETGGQVLIVRVASIEEEQRNREELRGLNHLKVSAVYCFRIW